jgi:Predicted nucleotide-binding protein containing TIR-like domain
MSEPSTAEIQIAAEVVHRFLVSRQPTPRLPLLKIAKQLDTLEKLSRWSILRPLDDYKFLPLALAFHYCGDADALALAKESVELVAELLKRMFEDCEEENKQYRLADVEQRAREMHGSVEPQKIWLGVYLGDELRLCSRWGSQPWEFTTVSINPHVIEIETIDNLWEEFVKERTDWIKGQIRGIPPSQPDFFRGEDQDQITTVDLKKVFVVHGHDQAINGSVAEFLQGLGLEVIILQEQPNRGQTIVEKLEAHSGVGFAVVILTPDDVGAPAKEPDKAKKRARQNVILELGLFIGKLGRERVCPLYVGELELPSDMHGLLYVPYDQEGKWRSGLRKELDAAGMHTSAAERGATAKTSS